MVTIQTIMGKSRVYVAPCVRGSGKFCWYFWEKIFVCKSQLFFQKQCSNTLFVEIKTCHLALQRKSLSFPGAKSSDIAS